MQVRLDSWIGIVSFTIFRRLEVSTMCWVSCQHPYLKMEDKLFFAVVVVVEFFNHREGETSCVCLPWVIFSKKLDDAGKIS